MFIITPSDVLFNAYDNDDWIYNLSVLEDYYMHQ